LETDAPWNPWWLRVVTQAQVIMPLLNATVVPPSDPAAYPSSGVLPAPPPAPVPSSGVLQATAERRTITTMSVKHAPSPRSPEGASLTRTARHFVPRRTAARSATQQKREDVARGVASTRVTTVREVITTRDFATATAPAIAERRYFNYVAPVVPSRPSARTPAAKRVPVRPGAPLVSTAIAVDRTTTMPAYRYIYEPDRILVVDPSTEIAVQAIPR
jgi:hypothetical protein